MRKPDHRNGQRHNTQGQATQNQRATFSVARCVIIGVVKLCPGHEGILWRGDPRHKRQALCQRHRPGQCAEHRLTVGIADHRISSPLRVRHHTEDAAVFRQNARDIRRGPVGVIGIGKGHTTVAFQTRDRLSIGLEVAIVVRDRQRDLLTDFIACGEGALGSHGQADGAADVFQTRVAHQRARQQAAFGQDLEAVADTQNIAAAGRMGTNGIHHRSAGRNRAAAQVIAMAETARHAHDIDALGQLAVFVPDAGDLISGLLKGGGEITVAVGPREGDDSGFHGGLRSHGVLGASIYRENVRRQPRTAERRRMCDKAPARALPAQARPPCRTDRAVLRQ